MHTVSLGQRRRSLRPAEILLRTHPRHLHLRRRRRGTRRPICRHLRLHRRQAAGSRQPPPAHLHAYLCGPPDYLGTPDLQRLAALSGRPTSVLHRTLTDPTPSPPPPREQPGSPSSRVAPPTSAARSAGGGTVDVDDRRAAPCPHHDKMALLAAGIALAVDRALRHVQKVARSGIDHVGPARSRLHPQQPAHHVDRGVVVGVVMPSRCRVRLGPDQPGPHPVNGDGLLSGHARGLLTLDPVTWWHPCDGLCRMHAVASSPYDVAGSSLRRIVLRGCCPVRHSVDIPCTLAVVCWAG